MSQQTPTLEAQTRTKLGSRYAIRLREEGKLPAVVYGHKQDPVHVSIDARELSDILHHGAHLIEVKVDGKTEPCLIKDVQYDYLDTTPVHVDLTRVDLNEEIEIELEVEFVGEPTALKQAGAMLSTPHTHVTVSCKANAIPESLTCDINELGMEDSIYVQDLKLPAGITLATEANYLLAQIVVQQAVTEDEGLAEGGDGEPEVIGAKKDEEDGGE
ncbi:MAG: 50S ribosomal protein L25 [Planctomycetota bacterium]